MSRKIRLAATLLIVLSLTAGRLSAFPLGHSPVFADRDNGALTIFVDWVASLFSWHQPQGKTPRHAQSKMATQLDPDGNH
jgi:hypothetical protein